VHLERLHRRHDYHENQIHILHTKLNDLVRAETERLDAIGDDLRERLLRLDRRNGPGGL
jgi:hypothetical protein